MSQYRWNVTDFARGYDEAAEHIHPYYNEIQEQILSLLPVSPDSDFLLLDAGGGSGRFIEKVLDRFPNARAVLIDQSESFLALAEQRLERFGNRAEIHLVKLQEDWTETLPEPPTAIVSMSAIHHLAPDEKQALYQRCFTSLADGGVLMNGDEVRAADDATYLDQCKTWAVHMHKVMDNGLAPEPIFEAMRQWEYRNVEQFGQPRVSGDDCHETVEMQLEYFATCGFDPVDAPWQQGMWAILRGVKS